MFHIHRPRYSIAVGVALWLGLASCGDSRGAPKATPLPIADGRAALLEPGPLSPRIANYRIAATFDPAKKSLDARMTLTWTNTGPRPVSTMPFHLYMNAFKNDQSVFMKESRGQHRRARASEEHWGYIDVTDVRIAGSAVLDHLTYDGPDETTFELALPSELAPGEQLEIELDFVVKLPQVFARTGFRGDFNMIAQWFPKPGVLQPDGTWHCEPFHLNSEFFADFGVYDVTLTVPDTQVIAATGVLVSVTQHDNGTRTLRYRAEDVHDFAWMADPWMDTISGQAHTGSGIVEVRVYYRPEQRRFAERHLHAALVAIEEFSRRFVPYPWPLMSVIDPPTDAASGAGGMEYPTMVTTAGDSAWMVDGVHLPEFVTVHEVGHNWFQGILASNEVDEAWMDEGVNEYADSLVMSVLFGEAGGMIDALGYQLDAFGAHGILPGTGPSPIATVSYDFADNSAYGAASYGKTAVALRSLSAMVGHERFEAALKAYARRYAFRHPTGADFFAALEAELGESLAWFTGPAFYQRGTIDLQVRRIDCAGKRRPRGVFGRGDERREEKPAGAEPTGFDCDVLLVNLGEVPAVVDIEVRYEGLPPTTHRWDGRPGHDSPLWHRLTLDSKERITEVIIDPDRRLPLNVGYAKSSLRDRRDGRATRRAAAGIQHWTQTLMQVSGL